MPLPTPFPGLIIRHAFLWPDEPKRGPAEGRKDRPCVVVLAKKRLPDGTVLVRVAPITHRPAAPDRAVELPRKLRRHLGLDDEAAWIVLDEINEFIWPGPDVRPLPHRPPGVFAYGVLPIETFAAVKAVFASVLLARRGKIIRRPD